MKNKLLFKAIMFIFFSVVFILGITYVMWRWFFTLNTLTSPFTTFWSYMLALAEILTLLVFTNFALILLSTSDIEKTIPDNKLQNDYGKDIYKDGELVTFKNYCPSVDIFICTLNEEADMLSTTISACKNIDYPKHKVYVLDDGRRPEIKELTEMLGCNYITRKTNKGFKAGNINNALSLTDSEIIVIFDADHIPASTFLRETVYNFTDEKTALVQTPQTFCNPDAFQKNLASVAELSNEQDIFYRIIEPSLSKFDSVFCGGTNILIRRKHLNEVGNFPENTITEDSLLGLIFHAHKYKVVYYNRPLAIGLAASSFEEYMKQRARWAKGNVQIITNPQNWKYYKNLNFIQRFFYLSGVLYFFTPISRLIFLVAPVLFLFFDISPVLILFYQIFAFQICYFSLKFGFIFSSKIKVNNIIYADVYDLTTSLFTISSILHSLILPGSLSKIKFYVTEKSFKIKSKTFKYKFPLYLILAMLLSAQIRGIYDLLYSNPYSVLAIIANLFWNTINIVVVLFGLKVASEKPERRMYQRVKLDDEVILEDTIHHKFKAQTNDASRSGVSFLAEDDLSSKDLNLNIEGEDNELTTLSCTPEKNKYLCKSKFKKPIAIWKLTKRSLRRLDRYVRFVYKNPDKWDDYYDKKNK